MLLPWRAEIRRFKAESGRGKGGVGETERDMYTTTLHIYVSCTTRFELVEKPICG